MKTRHTIKTRKSPLLCLAALALAVPTVHAATIYSQTWTGSATNNSLNGTTTTVGGGTWVSSEWRLNGTIATNNITTNDDGAYLSFTPTTGLIYTLSMTATQPSGSTSTSGWLGLGFTAGNTASDTSFTTATINAAPWLLWRPTIGSPASNVVTRLGPAVSADAVNEGAFTGTQTLTIVLNTQALAWTAEWFVGATSVRGPEAFVTNPTIANVGFARENGFGSTITSFSLTSVPEPGAALLGGLGLLSLLRRRR